MNWTNLFDSIDAVVKFRNISYEEAERLPFYEFKFIIDRIEADQKKQKEDEEKQKKEYDKSSKQQKTFKPATYGNIPKPKIPSTKNYGVKY